MSFSISEIKQAKERIAPYVVETPLLRMPNLDSFLGCQVYVKAECMQTTGAFKLRGAINKTLILSEEQRKIGVVSASSGNHGRGMAYAAKVLGGKATIVMPKTAPKLKIEAIKALGAEVVLCDISERFEIAERIQKETGAINVPPFNDEDIMAGQGTAGIEIATQCPELNKVIVPVSGGGLISGIATAVKALAPSIDVYGAEPSALPRYSTSLAAGKPVVVEQKPTVADALASPRPGEKCFPYVAKNVTAVAAVDDEYMLKAMKLMLTEGKILAEPSSCIGIGAVMQGLIKVTPEDKVCFFLSGGNVSIEQIARLDNVTL